jgi:hypothetical protein
MPYPCELILQRPDNCLDVLPFIVSWKYDYGFQVDITFLVATGFFLFADNTANRFTLHGEQTHMSLVKYE